MGIACGLALTLFQAQLAPPEPIPLQLAVPHDGTLAGADNVAMTR